MQQDLLRLGLNHPQKSVFYERTLGASAPEIQKLLQGALDEYIKQCPFFSDTQKQYSRQYLKGRISALSTAIALGNTQAIWL
jgi:hypothetical protein